ncbi:DUF2569 family protein [Paenibacillus sp. FSL L8-0499]|uniref:DUF2569 family protein n=1 Tax=Paenibacillus sp. FSL L8-0499 TaxID=2975334 RepID=UPI0030F86F1D
MVGIFTIFSIVIGTVVYKAYLDGIGGFFAVVFVAGFGGIGALLGYITEIIKKKIIPTKEITATVEYSSHAKSLKEKPFVYGFGGWLYSYSGFVLFLFFVALKAVNDNYLLIHTPEYIQLTTFGSEYYNSLLHPTIIMEMVAQLIVVILVLLIAYSCMKMKKMFKYLSITLFSVVFIFNILDLFLLLSIQNSYPEQLLDNTTYDGVIYSFFYFIVWVPYFLLSKRVKNTFIM